MPDTDLGFTVRTRKNGEVQILHRGRLAATLRGAAALDFLQDTPDPASADAPQTMARLTGNYRYGNERLPADHPRNRRDA
jgi:hypothetical protein